MPTVRFRTNLGSDEAREINGKTGSDLKIAECLCDAEVDVNKAAADLLIARGIAEVPEKSVKGVAATPEITAPHKHK